MTVRDALSLLSEANPAAQLVVEYEEHGPGFIDTRREAPILEVYSDSLNDRTVILKADIHINRYEE